MVYIANMTTKIKQIIDKTGVDGVLFGNWLSKQGMDSKQQYSYTQSGWLEHLARGVYKVAGSSPSLFAVLSCYNIQMNKQCIVGAQTALELRGLSHYVPMGKPMACLFTDNIHRLPVWLLEAEWDRTIQYQTTTFLGKDLLGVDVMQIDGRDLLVSSPERAVLEWLNITEIASALMDIYYVFEMLTTLRPKLLQQLLEHCNSVKVNRLFLYMAEKAGHQWLKSLDTSKINIGSGRRMVSATGKYIAKYNMTIPTELAEYE